MSEIITQVGRFQVRDTSRPVELDATGDATLSLDEWLGYDLRAVVVVFNDVPEVGGAEVKFARKTLGLKQKDFARVLGVNEYTVSDWERGEQPVSKATQRHIYEVLCHFQRCGQEAIDNALAERPKPPVDGILQVPQRMCG